MFDRSRDLVAAAGAALVFGMALSIGMDQGVLRVAFGLTLLLFLPGYVWAEALFPVGAVRGAERVAIVFGLSLALAVVGGLLLNGDPAGLETRRWTILTTLVVLLGALVAIIRRNRELPLPTLVRKRPKLRAPEALLFATAVLLAGAAAGIGTGAATLQEATDFTQLWLLQRGESSVNLGVANLESNPVTYRVEVNYGGTPTYRPVTFELQPGERWQATVVLPANESQRNVEALLYRLDRTASPYRRTEIWLTRGIGTEGAG